MAMAITQSLLHTLLSQPNWLILLFSLGLLSLTKFTISLLRYSYRFLLRPAKDLKSRYGTWAVITGPTDGIGKAMAFELAKKGLHLILVGRNPAKLTDVSAAIKAEFPETIIKNVAVDLSSDLGDGIRRLKEAITDLDVGVAVNNAGLIDPVAMFFHEVEMEKWMKMIKVNLEAVTEVAKAVLPGMMERGRGAIVNVGSGSTVVIPSYPLFTVYAATKAYIDQLSKSLHVEYKSKGIDVQCHVPMYVATKMISEYVTVTNYSIFIVATANAYASAAVRWIGYEAQCMPYLPHFLQWCYTSLVPDFILDQMELRSHMNEREKLIRSKQRG